VSKVTLNVVPTMEKTAASMTVTLADGRTISTETPLALGNPGNPMKWSDLEAKFTGLSEPILGKAGAATVFSNLRQFGKGGDLKAVFAELDKAGKVA